MLGFICDSGEVLDPSSLRWVDLDPSVTGVADPPLTMAVHRTADKHISEHLAASGRWEPYETSLFLSAIRPGSLVVDCGANIGWYTLLAASRGTDVLAVEPSPANAALLRASLDRNGLADRVVVVEAAAGEAAGFASLRFSTDNQGDHRLGGSLSRDSIDVPVVTVDDLLATHFPGRAPTLMKLDTQGSEVAILRGARTAWQATAAPTIVMEFWPYGLTTCGYEPDDLLALLADMVDITHKCAEIREWAQSTHPLAMTDLRQMAAEGGYSLQMRGFTNLVLVPLSAL
jgi:FkbM family methyltransferase